MEALVAYSLQPALSQRDPTSVAWRLRGGRRRRSEPRHRDRRGEVGVHDLRAEPSLHRTTAR